MHIYIYICISNIMKYIKKIDIQIYINNKYSDNTHTHTRTHAHTHTRTHARTRTKYYANNENCLLSVHACTGSSRYF